ncbi:alpha/beta fold hydrolase [Clostridium taeniosporum]|uniref:Alpha/beta hydrolase n=1 Tax=Clostridium taeniosporum TaxID=394958 RepID=A0A1D7XPA2_9CLOT|nr:alpha/beta hydrolase [Clostridium taeniosporum]AOR25162.1 alpha/beta hydrolase [Clostridium taeniosporum]
MAYFKYKERNVYYEEIGTGEPLLLLHGNTASSKMFQSVISLYQARYKIVLIDFLGHGQSERIDKFPVDLWFDEAMQVITLLENLKYKKVKIIGSSGGALVALNVALERPDLVKCVVADSFKGEIADTQFTNKLQKQREISKQDKGARLFYSFCHGGDWEQVVDNDTNAVCEHAIKVKKFLHKSLKSLNTKVLLIASKKDEFIGSICENAYSKMLEQINNGQMYLFNDGGHPVMISNPKKVAQVVMEFLDE